MVSIPIVLGLCATHAASLPAWSTGAATFLAFLAHYAIVPWAARTRVGKPSPPGYAVRRIAWGVVYLAGSVACFAPALLVSQAQSAVLPIAATSAGLAAVYAAASIVGAGRMLFFEILGMGGMALVAPMMAAAAGHPVSDAIFAPAYLALSYFLSSVAFVRTYDGVKRHERPAIARCLAAQAAIVLGLIVVARLGGLVPLWWLSWLPIVGRSALGVARPPANLRALGVREAWVAVAFTLIAASVVVWSDCTLPRPPAG